MSVISFQNFSLSYGTKLTLDNVTLSVEEGDYVAIIGPNGAGKSTLLKSLLRIVKGNSGTIKVMDKDILHYSQKEIGRTIGYVSQNKEHVIPFTAFEFVLMGRYPYLNPLSRITIEDKAIVEESLRRTEAEQFRQRKISTLSGGERQKVYLAAAFAQYPKILLLDEPTIHLDPRYQVEIQKAIADACHSWGMTVLHVTHDFNHITSVSNKVVALKKGKIIKEGSPQEILRNDPLKEIFDTDFMSFTHPESGQQVIVPKG